MFTNTLLERMFGEEGFQSFRDRALFGLCRYTAARISEVCQMKISDVFLPSGKVKSEIVFRTETTKGEYGQKTVKVSPDLRALLEAYDVPEKGIYLFPGRHGRSSINPVSASHLFKEVCDRLELHRVSTHI
ncbi:site-specific integrase [Phormidesmis priestleyi]|uniref:site-specific integrase n=1 Tax=Phormidesmis priestleyi TaxID=268141 RepID=UPI0012E8A833|nr:site-specific integrase [Phormidesmis priestleyi]